MSRILRGCCCVVAAATAAVAGGAPAQLLGDGIVNTASLTIFNIIEYPTARCLDGTGAGFYYRAGAGADADKWLVMLEGGGFCSGANAVQRVSAVSAGKVIYFLATQRARLHA